MNKDNNVGMWKFVAIELQVSPRWTGYDWWHGG